MSKIRTTAIFIGIIIFTSCQTPQDEKGVFNILPLPQVFEITGTSGLTCSEINTYYLESDAVLPVPPKQLKHITATEAKSKAQLVCRIDNSLDLQAEGYTMEIKKKQITIVGKDKDGLFYGLRSLDQLMIDANEQDVNLPTCKITDSPSLSYRAIHLDIKHHREKLEYYYGLMDWLAGYKINAIIAEVEDKIKYERQPLVGSDDAISIENWKKLSDYALERNIEISPLVQGLGHASFILKHDQYKSLRDDPDSDWAFNPLDPETYKVQFDLYLDAIEALPHGKYLHVGGDEVHTTGRGSGKSNLELQLIWLNKVSKFAEEHNRIPIFWDDMPLKSAGVYSAMFNRRMTEEEVEKIWSDNEHKLLEFLDEFPKNCIYMRWNYSSPEAIGNAKAMEWFRKQDLPVMGASAGQTRWVLMPQNESNMQCIRDFAVPSIENGLNGLLLTLWDDDSPHFELYKRGIIAFAEYTWSGDKRSKEDIKSAYRQREFSYTLAGKDKAFIDQLEGPVSFWKNALLKGNKRNYIVKSKDPLEEAVMDLPDPESKGEWTAKHGDRLERAEGHLRECEIIAEKIEDMKSMAVRNKYTISVYEQVNKLVLFTNKSLLLLNEYDSSENKEKETAALSKIKALQDEFEILRKEFESVYGVTRILTKPDNYILDQDHHVHLANQTKSFDWQFMAEIKFLEKLAISY